MNEENILDVPKKIEPSAPNNPFRYGVISAILLSLIIFSFNILNSFILLPIMNIIYIPFLLLSIGLALFFFIFRTKYYNHKLIKVIPSVSIIVFTSIIFNHFISYLKEPSEWFFDLSMYFGMAISSIIWGWLFSYGIFQWIKYPNRKWILILIYLGLISLNYLIFR